MKICIARKATYMYLGLLIDPIYTELPKLQSRGRAAKKNKPGETAMSESAKAGLGKMRGSSAILLITALTHCALSLARSGTHIAI